MLCSPPPPTDPSHRLQPHTCGSEEQALSITRLADGRAAQAGQGLRRVAWIHTHTPRGAHPSHAPRGTGCRLKAHASLEGCPPRRSSTRLLNFPARRVLQKPPVRHSSGCSRSLVLKPSRAGFQRRTEQGLPSLVQAGAQVHCPQGGFAPMPVKPLCGPPSAHPGARRGSLGALRACSTSLVGAPPPRGEFQVSLLLHQISTSETESGQNEKVTPRSSGRFKQKLHCLHPERCMFGVGTGSGVRWKMCSENAEPSLEEIKYSPGPSHVLK